MNLLIVDDEIVTTQVLEEQLDRALLSIDQIYVAYNTSMARDILQKNKVELILCDIEMPKENGIHFLEWVREQKIQTEVIFLTSHEKFEYAYGAVQLSLIHISELRSLVGSEMCIRDRHCFV